MKITQEMFQNIGPASYHGEMTEAEYAARRAQILTHVKEKLGDHVPVVSLSVPDPNGTYHVRAYNYLGHELDTDHVRNSVAVEVARRFVADNSDYATAAAEILHSSFSSAKKVKAKIAPETDGYELVLELARAGLIRYDDTNQVLHLCYSPGIHASIPTFDVGSAVRTVQLRPGAQFALPSGFVGVIGAAGTGKTPFSLGLSMRSTNPALVRAGEPFAGYHMSLRSAFSELVADMFTSDVVVLDSIKDALTGGAAMKGGLSRSVLPLISGLSIVGTSLGVTIISPINPSSADTDMLESLTNAVSSNATAVFASTGNEWFGQLRTREGGIRHEMHVKLLYKDGQGYPDLIFNDSEGSPLDEVDNDFGAPGTFQEVFPSFVSNAVRLAVQNSRG